MRFLTTLTMLVLLAATPALAIDNAVLEQHDIRIDGNRATMLNLMTDSGGELYVVRSPDFDDKTATGDSEEAAQENFRILLDSGSFQATGLHGEALQIGPFEGRFAWVEDAKGNRRVLLGLTAMPGLTATAKTLKGALSNLSLLMEANGTRAEGMEYLVNDLYFLQRIDGTLTRVQENADGSRLISLTSTYGTVYVVPAWLKDEMEGLAVGAFTNIGFVPSSTPGGATVVTFDPSHEGD